MGEIFEVFGINWKLITIQIINFSIVMTVLSYFLYRPVLKLLTERKKEVEKSIEQIARAETAGEEAKKEREKIVKEAYTESEEIVRRAKESAEEKREAILENARERDARMREQNTKELAAERRRMLDESRKEVARTATLTAEKILRGNTG